MLRVTASPGETYSPYSDRCAFWIAESEPKFPRRVREREATPLVLTGHGLSLRVDKGCLLVRDGNTHYPAEQRERRFFNAALDIPPALVVLDGSGNITLDAIDWLARHRVPLIRVRWDGQFASIVTSGGQAASADKVAWQQRTRCEPRARLAFAIELIRQKARNTLLTLDGFLPRGTLWERAFKNIESRARSLKKTPPGTFASLLGIEGSIAADYFRVWSELPVKWKPLKKYPIPSDWKTYRSRVALRHGIRLRADGGGYNRGATHPVNAMLNYAYAVLMAQTQIRLIVGGYDPTIGVMHEKKALRGINPGFALDHMEPMRPVVDRVVLHLIDAVTFTGADFSIQHDGICRMNPELARRVAQLALERCEVGGRWSGTATADPKPPMKMRTEDHYLKERRKPLSPELPARPPQGMLPRRTQDQEGADGGRVAKSGKRTEGGRLPELCLAGCRRST